MPRKPTHPQWHDHYDEEHDDVPREPSWWEGLMLALVCGTFGAIVAAVLFMVFVLAYMGTC